VIGTRLRQAAGFAVLAVLVVLGIKLIPIYLHDQELQRFVEDVSHRPAAPAASDDVLRSWVLAKATDLELPVTASNIKIQRAPGTVRLDVRYVVRVDLPMYTVDLHFYPGAGSR
jgi:uncharacterized protein DUF4845